MVQLKVAEGILEGQELENDYGGKIFSFKGVPYAQPPIGDLRFKAPQPLQPWEGVRNAKEHGPICYQFDAFLKAPPSGSEDCLYLNVYTPNIKPDKPLPVMFWIHGGGYMSGSGNDDIYGPEFLLRHDVILVTINYRTEVLGFLCLDTEDIPGNAGLKDQVAALRWVKKNISNFGGDPENITIFGESAGGSSVTFHLISPMTKGLFKRAIAQSGAALNNWSVALEPRERAKALARKLGLDSDDDKELYEFFKVQPVESLINASVPLTLNEEVNVNFSLNYGPVSEKQFDGNERFFYGDIYDVLRNGIHEGIEVMAGFCEKEGILLFGMGNEKEKIFTQFETYPEMFAPKEISRNCSLKTTFEVGRKLKEFYSKGKDISSDPKILIDFVSMDMFTYGVIQWQKFSSLKNKTYLYKFGCKSERNWIVSLMGLGDLESENKIVGHADDLPYIFPMKIVHQKVDMNSKTFKMINNMTTLWTNFAKFGNPTPDASLGIQWEPFTMEDEKYLEIGEELVMAKRPNEEQTEFWENIFRKYYPHCVA